MTFKHWTTETDDAAVAWICINKADGNANVLSTEVMLELDQLLKSLEINPPRGIVIWSGKPGGFIMGADITEFSGIDSPERAYEVTRLGQQLFDRIEALPCPTVTAINGFCLGGGLELAMSTDYRVALANPAAHSRPARSTARPASRLRRHCASRANLRCAPRHATHAHGQTGYGGQRRDVSDWSIALRPGTTGARPVAN